MSETKAYEVYDLGDFPLKSGSTIPKAQIAYKTFGSASSPAIVYPSWYSGLISDTDKDKDKIEQRWLHCSIFAGSAFKTDRLTFRW